MSPSTDSPNPESKWASAGFLRRKKLLNLNFLLGDFLSVRFENLNFLVMLVKLNFSFPSQSSTSVWVVTITLGRFPKRNQRSLHFNSDRQSAAEISSRCFPLWARETTEWKAVVDEKGNDLKTFGKAFESSLLMRAFKEEKVFLSRNFLKAIFKWLQLFKVFCVL